MIGFLVFVGLALFLTIISSLRDHSSDDWKDDWRSNYRPG